MLGLLRNIAPDLQLTNYRERLEKAVSVLAKACGVDPERELERFRWCHERLGRDSEAPVLPPLAADAHVLEQLSSATAQGLPLFFEMVLSHRTGGAPRFAYLTQGSTAGTLVQSLGGLLNAVLSMHIESHGEVDDGELLARQFCLAFPGLATLDKFAPTAQAMLLGIVPAGDETRFKVYFNTRMDTSTPHRERALALLESCGVEDDGLYALLYEETEGARFHGVGIDVGSGRAKLYVHVPRERVEETLGRLGRHLHGNGDAAGPLLEPAHDLVAALEGKALLEQLEVAVALQPNRATTTKLTAFLSPKRSGAEDVERVIAFVESMGHDSEPLRRATESLSAGIETPDRQKQPVRGVGIETPTGERAKVNVYLQATM